MKPVTLCRVVGAIAFVVVSMALVPLLLFGGVLYLSVPSTCARDSTTCWPLGWYLVAAVVGFWASLSVFSKNTNGAIPPFQRWRLLITVLFSLYFCVDFSLSVSPSNPEAIWIHYLFFSVVYTSLTCAIVLIFAAPLVDGKSRWL